MTLFDDLPLDSHWLWMLAGLAFGIAEIIAPGFFLIWLGLAALATGLIALATGLTVALQFGLFALLAIASVYSGRRWFSSARIDSSDPLLNDRAARLIGETVTVVDAIDGGLGRVRVGDGVWNAKGEDAPAGARVRVTGIDGGALLVERLS